MADLLNIGVNGLLAYQRSLSTTSHNIANVNTEGYRRQRVELGTQTPQYTGAGFEGSGVKVSAVKSIYNQFIESQLTTNTSLLNEQETLYRLSSDLDNLLADPDVGLSPVLQNFFKSLQDLSTDPSSTPVRQVVLSEADALTSIFNDTYNRLNTEKDAVNSQVSSAVTDINSLSLSIASINNDIILASGGSATTPPNDLIDQRQNLLNDLAELVNLNTVTQSDGSINVFIGKGQSLVVGTSAQQLTTVANEYDAGRLEVALVAGSGTVNINNQISGGKLGGALTFRKDVLDKTFLQLGRVAMGLATDMNEQHKLGYDLNNTLGTNFFSDLTTTTAVDSANNAGTTNHVYNATVTDSGLLQASDYRLSYGAGGAYSVTRLSDNKLIGTNTNLATLSTAVSASEGFSLALGSGSSIAVGDSFLISPVKTAAGDIGVSLTNTSQIAAASPIIAARNAANTGDSKFINDGLISSTGTLPSGAITFTFNSGTNTFVASPAISTTPNAATIAYNPATDSGKQYTVTLAGVGDYQFTVTGTPANSDSISINVNTNGSGDNRNIASMLALQEKKTLANGTANYQESFSELVADVGVKTKRAEFAMDANQVLYDRAQSAQLEVSGVNLDEEAADLIRFQQAYQAVARIISSADELFQSLLGAVSR